ncbi:MAG: hypothetical protein WD851_04930 [Pirellulales bacterium]
MKLHFIDEPELEFAGAGRHIDIRHGLTEHGPLDRGLPSAPQAVRAGVVGAAKDVERLRAWIDHCRSGVDAKSSKRTTLFVGFPGFGGSETLCDFIVDDRLIDVISSADIRDIGEAAIDEFYTASIKRYREGAADLIEKANANVVLCLLPEEFVRRIDVPATPETGPRSRHKRNRNVEVVWHDAFKAEALDLARPVQIVRPATYGGNVHHFTRDGSVVREMQDEATRAWNFFCALYYKAGGIPWRLARESTDLMTCYMGISFYHDPASETLRTSVAQVFNERGEGMVVRGGPAVLDDRDHTPHLSPKDAEQLLTQAVNAFRREHRTSPARLVIHKSSYFTAAELEGGAAAVKQLHIDAYDLLSLRPSHTRLYRAHSYPPLRGTAVIHTEGCLLYTQGSVDFYRCYPGLYAPRTLDELLAASRAPVPRGYPGLYAPRTLDVQLDHAESGEIGLLSELLALTKMNWNSTELINLEPITLSAARNVGGILRYVSSSRTTQSRYSFFM